MEFIKEKLLENINVRVTTQFIFLTGLAMVLPFFIHLQWITGPIVNAIFILVSFLVGIRSALAVALIPSLMALSGGLLPAILAPVAPFIMIGNVIFILTIDWFYQRFKNDQQGYWAGVIIGAGLKFIWLFFSVSLISKLLIKQELTVKVAQMMSWPQFATAVIGGMLAWSILKWLKKF